MLPPQRRAHPRKRDGRRKIRSPGSGIAVPRDRSKKEPQEFPVTAVCGLGDPEKGEGTPGHRTRDGQQTSFSWEVELA